MNLHNEWRNSEPLMLACLVQIHNKTFTFLSRPLQNNNVKLLHSVYLRERKPRRQFFHVSDIPIKNNFDTVRHTEYI